MATKFRASIRKDPKKRKDGSQSWVLDLSSNGVREQRRYPRKADAVAAKEQAEKAHHGGGYVPLSASPTVKEAAKVFVTHRETVAGLEKSSIKLYRSIIDRIINPALGEYRLSEVDTPAVGRFLENLIEQGTGRATVKTARTVLGMVFKHAMQLGVTPANPVSAYRLPSAKRKKSRVEVPAMTDVSALLETAKGSGDYSYPMLMVMVFAGLRISEARGLRGCDIDLAAGLIHVRQRISIGFEEAGTPKSEAGNRTIPIGPQAVAVLREWMLQRKPTEADLLFPDPEGDPYTYGKLRVWFRNLQQEADVMVQTGRDDEGRPVLEPKLTFHSCRHFAASRWIAAKVSDKQLQTWCGHASIQTTYDIYGHLLVGADDHSALAANLEAGLIG